jgi:hypothetical protein
MPLLNTADAVYFGADAADAVYFGADQVWPAAGGGDPINDLPSIRLNADFSALGLSNGAAIASVPDSAGVNATGLTQGTSGSRPTFAAANQNGLGVATFDGIDDWFNVPDGLGSASAWTTFLVVKADADAPDHGIGLWSLQDVATAADATNFPYNGDGQIYESAFTSARKVVGDPTPSLAQWNIYEIVSASGKYEVMLNGSVIFTTASNAPANPDPVAIGRSHNFDASNFTWYQGKIGQWVVCGQELDGSTRDVARSALQSKWATA